MAKRRKLKKQVYYVLIGLIAVIIAVIYGNNKYQEYKYHQTYEYKLLEHGYTNDEVKTILDLFTDSYDLEYFLNNEVNSNFILLTKEKYYLAKNFYKYIDYMKENKKLALEDVILNINIHLDQEYYSLDLKADTSLDTKILVNKYYSLDKDFTPSDIVSISQKYAWGDVGSKKIRQVAYDAFTEMWDAAQEEQGYYLMVNSAYRTYEEQENVYNNYKNKNNTKYADSIAARPGSSEHQTGLALDIFSKAHPNRASFAESEEFEWLKNNAYRFGFILRYPDGKKNLTGFDYEAWHYRYVGKEIAKYIYENNITLEEYYAYFIEK